MILERLIELRVRIEPETGLPYTETSPGLLAFTVGLALLAGLILFGIAKFGRQLWLMVWSAGLVICSTLYLGYYFLSA